MLKYLAEIKHPFMAFEKPEQINVSQVTDKNTYLDAVAKYALVDFITELLYSKS